VNPISNHLITVGIPTFNNHETITQTIDSLKAQTFANWECFITDDSDDDLTFEAARLAIADDPRFTLIKNPQRLGAASNWNKCLSLASGHYFKLLCADDVLDESALELQLAALSEHTGSVLCTGRRDIINSVGKVLIKDRGLRSEKMEIEKAEAVHQFILTGTNIFGEPSFALFQTQVLRDVGGFDNRWNYLIDVVSYLSVLDHGSLVVVDANLGKFRVSSTSWSAALVKQQRSELLHCIDFASELRFSEVNSFEVLIGKIKATINSYGRRIIFALAN
jgi:glycosyltransferase involved in cell wall biosynthesis